eukprot:scaffold42342_cov52-Attheya_sp.AAC.4
MRYTDHGTHGMVVVPDEPNDSHMHILKRLMLTAKETYGGVDDSFDTTTIHDYHSDSASSSSKGTKKRMSPIDSLLHLNLQSHSASPRKLAQDSQKMSQPHGKLIQPKPVQISMEDNSHQPSTIGDTLSEDNKADSSSEPDAPKSSLLHDVLQDTSSSRTSQTANANGPATSKTINLSTSTPKNIALETTEETPVRGECLTNPHEPSSNHGLDNSEGNLIVHKLDIIMVASHMVQDHRITHQATPPSRRNTLRRSKSERLGVDSVSSPLRRSRGLGIPGSGTDGTSDSKRSGQSLTRWTRFEVIGLLGQGTFAQVFKCRNMVTDEVVAVKIVKNKPAYTRQAAVEVDVFRALAKDHVQPVHGTENTNGHDPRVPGASESMVQLLCYFMHNSHLCLVFELLGLNLYEVLKRRQFRGLPIGVVRSLLKQAIYGVKELSQRSIVHCDLKPENILLADEESIESFASAGESKSANHSGHQNHNDDSLSSSSQVPVGSPESGLSLTSGRTSCDTSTPTPTPTPNHDHDQHKIKLIDLGSACFEGQTAHTYIQSRFYRSPEVLVGIPYDSAIDMWSLGCVAAELFLGLPILPGIHEYDQLGRIEEMIGPIPDWMIEEG